jgi:hypothetical protein
MPHTRRVVPAPARRAPAPPLCPPLPTDYLTRPRMRMTAIAELCQVSRMAVCRWVTVGARGLLLRSFFVGGRRYVLEQDLHAFLAELREGHHVA